MTSRTAPSSRPARRAINPQAIARDALHPGLAEQLLSTKDIIAHFASDQHPYADRLRKKAYESHLQLLQIELLKAQRWAIATEQKIVILFEGRDAAGKGGTIKRFIEHLNPRHTHVVALNKPTPEEQGQWYFQRYIRHFPSNGHIALFDRSWYNRAGVERVMDFCTQEQYQEFMLQAPALELMMVSSDIHLFKFWLTVGQEEQQARFNERRQDPLKQWKLSPIDEAAQSRWDDYTQAKEDMFFYTDTAHAPWTIVKSSDKKRARIACLQHFLSSLEYPEKRDDLLHMDPLIVGQSEYAIG
ncbi:polyphosphate kinase 2 [Halioglobus sp. HI00S01]|uniref:polyphosphate kinase 2 n=1 Tax=Halioglobus sp. HI00S01 TaxID=1822214 RepID=UPI0007C2E48E|nr:polyphosphate kinase 2 [Halioglobus sp. HI00S01]KZX56858.1 polyphosphate kinase 2 [Halioglobus sp. HI00S01]